MICGRFQLPSLLLVWLLFLHSTCAVFLSQGLEWTISASFLITFLFPGNVTFINMHVPFSLTLIMNSGLLLRMVLSVCTCWFYYVVTSLVSTNFGTCLYQWQLSDFTSISVYMFKCSWARTHTHTHTHTLSIMCFYVVFFCQSWACWCDMVYCLFSRHIFYVACFCCFYLY